MEHLATRAMFAGYDPAEGKGAVKPPIYLTSTFIFPDAATGAQHMESAYGVDGVEAPEQPGYIYSRLANPTVVGAEQRLAAWDESEDAAFFASGMAAISTTLLAWSGADRPVWFCPPLYGGTEHFLREVLPGMGVQVVELDGLDDLDAVLEREGRRPGLVYLETPANPTMQQRRIASAAEWAKRHSTEDHPVLTVVDNTFLGPILQRPLEHGADLLVYSATKYLGGHSDLIAGAVSGRAAAMQRVKEFRSFLGGTLDPNTAWMLGRSMETLHVRVERQQAHAEEVLAFLRQHSAVASLHSAWPADCDAETAAIAAEQTRGGGSMIAFEVKGGRTEAFAFLDALKHFKLAVSLGSVESLAEHPASMTHAGVPADVKAATGITEGLIRLSIGLEHPADLIADLDHALKVATSAQTA